MVALSGGGVVEAFVRVAVEPTKYIKKPLPIGMDMVVAVGVVPTVSVLDITLPVRGFEIIAFTGTWFPRVKLRLLNAKDSLYK